VLFRSVVKMINESIGKTVHVPQDPQNVGAYGCAILGMNY
jgi:activator of 2-hydroxyglutaryl-CoA dehydratase